MNIPDGLSAEQIKLAADELSALTKQRNLALQAAAYIPMSKQEARAYDERLNRIGRLNKLLGKSRIVL